MGLFTLFGHALTNGLLGQHAQQSPGLLSAPSGFNQPGFAPFAHLAPPQMAMPQPAQAAPDHSGLPGALGWLSNIHSGTEEAPMLPIGDISNTEQNPQGSPGNQGAPIPGQLLPINGLQAMSGWGNGQ